MTTDFEVSMPFPPRRNDPRTPVTRHEEGPTDRVIQCATVSDGGAWNLPTEVTVVSSTGHVRRTVKLESILSQYDSPTAIGLAWAQLRENGIVAVEGGYGFLTLIYDPARFPRLSKVTVAPNRGQHPLE